MPNLLVQVLPEFTAGKFVLSVKSETLCLTAENLPFHKLIVQGHKLTNIIGGGYMELLRVGGGIIFSQRSMDYGGIPAHLMEKLLAPHEEALKIKFGIGHIKYQTEEQWPRDAAHVARWLERLNPTPQASTVT